MESFHVHVMGIFFPLPRWIHVTYRGKMNIIFFLKKREMLNESEQYVSLGKFQIK
jgi:hypothetical protein